MMGVEQYDVSCGVVFFFFNDTATTEIYTLSLHDALPISTAGTNAASPCNSPSTARSGARRRTSANASRTNVTDSRSEEHTSELQSLAYLVCRLLLEKKKNNTTYT